MRKLVLCLMLGLANWAVGSQIANHIRVALLVKDDPRTPPQIKALLDRNLDFYKAGAAGPDVLTNLVGVLSHKHHEERELGKREYLKYGFSLAKDAHYRRTGQLLTQMLRLAASEKDPLKREQQLAYALGWLTHYWVDSMEHVVVNQYGGFYEVNPLWHRQMEAFESTHVFSIADHPPESYIAPAAGFPTDFVNHAFGAAFPDYWNRGTKEKGQALASKFMRKLGSGKAWGITKDLDAASYVMEAFTQSMVDKFRQQRGNVVSVTADMAMNVETPLGGAYHWAVEPLMIHVDHARIHVEADKSKVIVRAELEWWVLDGSLLLAYITDWYPSIDAAREKLIADFVRLGPSITGTSPPINIDKNAGGFFQDLNLDTGEHENMGSANSTAMSEKFKALQEIEIEWALAGEGGSKLKNGKIKVDIGAEDLWLPGGKPITSFHGFAPIEVELPFSTLGVESSQAELSATIRGMNPIPHLISGPYLKGLVFESNHGGWPVLKDTKTKAVVEDSDRTEFELPSSVEAAMNDDEDKGDTAQAVDLSDLEQRLREILDRLAGIVSEAKQRLAEGNDAIRQLTAMRGPASPASLASDFQSLQQQLTAVPGLVAMAEQSSRRVVQARDAAEAAALRACEAADQLMSATDPQRAQMLRDQAELGADEARRQAIAAREAYLSTRDSADAVQDLFKARLALKSRQYEVCRDYRSLMDAFLAERAGVLGQAQFILTGLRGLGVERDGLVAEGFSLVAEAKERLVPALPSKDAVDKLRRMETTQARLQSYGQEELGFGSLSRSLERASQEMAAMDEAEQGNWCDASAIPEVNADLASEASAWVDAAELFVDPAEKAARSAAVCAKVKWDPPLVTSSGPPPPQPTGTTPNQPTPAVSDDSAQAAGRAVSEAQVLVHERCNYQGALSWLGEAARLNPSDPQIERLRAEYQRQAAMDQEARAALDQAWQDYVDGRFDDARAGLSTARALGSRCIDEEANDLDQRIGQERDRIAREQERVREQERIAEEDRMAREERRARNREAAGQLVGTLIDVARVVQGESPRGNTGSAFSQPTQTMGTTSQQNSGGCGIMVMGNPLGSSRWGLFKLGGDGSYFYWVLQGPRPNPNKPFTVEDWYEAAKKSIGAHGRDMQMLLVGSRSEVVSRAEQLCPNPVSYQSY